MKGQSAAGTHRHLVTVQGPSAPIPDGDGGFTEGWVNLVPPTWYCSIEPATARDLERVAAGTVIGTATHIITGRFHPQIELSTRLVYDGRVFQVTGVSNPEERKIRTIVTAVELLDAVPLVDTSFAQAGFTQ